MRNLPKIAMGAWAWGDTDGYFGNTMTGEEFRPIFEAAVNAGLNLWDTATAYSNGESEKILGKLVNDAGREKIIVSTKFTPQMAGMYGDSVVKMCEASLKRMNMEYFDIYWMHDIGILASLDPVALDQACIDLVYGAEDGQSLINRIESRNGLHTLEQAEKIGLGSREYQLVSIDG